MVGIMKKPRKQRELSNTVQRGVAAVVKRTTGGGATGKAAGGGARSGSSSRKRKPRAADADGAAAAAGIGQVDVEMADAMAPPPAKQQRRTAGPSTRQQQLLAAAEAEAAVGSGIGDTAAVAEGSSQSQTDGHEGNIPSQQPATSSHSAGSHPQDLAQPPRASTAYSFRSSSNAGLSGAVLEGSMGQVRPYCLLLLLRCLRPCLAVLTCVSSCCCCLTCCAGQSTCREFVCHWPLHVVGAGGRQTTVAAGATGP